MADAQGICKYLDQGTNLCTIYATRPRICNVDDMYEHYFRDKMERDAFYELNKKACRKMQEERGQDA